MKNNHFTSDAQFSRFVRRQIVSCAHINNFALGIWRHYATRTLHNLTERPFIYYVIMVQEFSDPPTHFVSINKLLNVSKTDFFLDPSQPPRPVADVIYEWYLRDDKSPNGDVSDIPHPRKIENRCILKLFLTAYQSPSLYVSMKCKDIVSI